MINKKFVLGCVIPPPNFLAFSVIYSESEYAPFNPEIARTFVHNILSDLYCTAEIQLEATPRGFTNSLKDHTNFARCFGNGVCL